MTKLDYLASICARARKVNARVNPVTPTPHGFRDPEGFMAHAIARGGRERAYKSIFKRILDRQIARGLVPMGVSL